MKTTISFLCALLLSTLAPAADADAVKKLFKSKEYTVTWGEAPKYRANAVLEVGSGNGHGWNLDWLRFLPDKDGVEVLSIRIRGLGKSRTVPELNPEKRIVVERASMSAAAYQLLLDELAIAESARLTGVRGGDNWFSTNDFWVNAELSAEKKTLLRRDWAGYEAAREVMSFAKPQVMTELAEAAVKKLKFKEHELTAAERAWMSEKFARDWKRFKGEDMHWWVLERYLEIVTEYGDKSVLPALRDILKEPLPPKDDRSASDLRYVAAAILAVDRILKLDRKVKLNDEDETTIEAERKKTLELLKHFK